MTKGDNCQTTSKNTGRTRFTETPLPDLHEASSEQPERDRTEREPRLQRCDWTAPGMLDWPRVDTKRKYRRKREGVRPLLPLILSWIVIRFSLGFGRKRKTRIRKSLCNHRLAWVCVTVTQTVFLAQKLKSPPPPSQLGANHGRRASTHGLDGHNGRVFDAWCQ